MKQAGGKVLYGGQVLGQPGYFVEPTIVKAENHWPIVQRETFAPILYVMPFKALDDAIAMQNAVPQGLSSAIFHVRRADTASGSHPLPAATAGSPM